MKIALGQMTSADTYEPNIATLRRYAEDAASGGAALLCLPEVAGLMNRDRTRAAALVGPFETDPYFRAAQEAAKDCGIWIHVGSSPVTGPEGKFLNRSALVSPEGEIAAVYDKIHLFDVALEGARPIGESKRFAAGSEAVLAHTPVGKLGMTICYDLRFPGLYRDLAQAGAEAFFIPSAFTVPTGKAHWELLLRARAIECGAFVIAAAQVGHHTDGRDTWGHSLVVDPWGKVVVDMGGSEPGLTMCEIDLSLVADARRQIPSLTHDRAYVVTDVP